VQLLVSVSDAEEARTALIGGATIIDAKDPSRGALGAVAPDALRAIRVALDGRAPLSAAIGDVRSETAAAVLAHRAARYGAAFVKAGLRGITAEARATALAAALVRGAETGGSLRGGTSLAVLVAYADSPRTRALPPRAVLEAAARARAGGVLLDTAFKDGGALFDLMPPDEVAAWVARAHALGLTAALAGSLDAGGVALARQLGADIAGVRTAACEGGRTGRVSADRVRTLAALAGGEVTVASDVEARAAAEHRHAGALSQNPFASRRGDEMRVAASPQRDA
jgi:uncharacterized protein (UPF0264 family)